MSQLTLDEINEYANNKLQAHTQFTEEFNKDLANLYSFYKAKLFFHINQPEHQEQIKEELFKSIKSQIFNGYFIGMEIINAGPENFEDKWFEQSKGMILQQIPDLLRTSLGEKIEETLVLEPLRKMIAWLVREYEGIYPILFDLALNTVTMGTTWAFLDEGKKRGKELFQSTLENNGVLADYEDISYISPETYIHAHTMNNAAEVWTLTNSRYAGFEKIGEVIVLKLANTEEHYYVNVSISSSFSFSEQNQVVELLLNHLMVRNNIAREFITLSGSSVNEFFEENSVIN